MTAPPPENTPPGPAQPEPAHPSSTQPAEPKSGYQQTLDSASAALGGADPQSLYRSGQCFTATAEHLRAVTDEFRARLRTLESAWSGPGAQAFAEATTGITHRLDGLVSALSFPDYGWLCRELGDALANGQRELQQLRDERASQQGGAPPPQAGTSAAPPTTSPLLPGASLAPGSSAAAPAGQQQVSPQDGRANKVMNELANAYRQLGGQLRTLPGPMVETPHLRQVAQSEVGSTHPNGSPTPDTVGSGRVDAVGAPHGHTTGSPPAGGVLGKHPPSHRTPESTMDHSAPAGGLGRPEPAGAYPTALALTGGTLGRAHHEHRHTTRHSGKVAHAESDQPGVLGNPARTVSAQPEHFQRDQAQHKAAQHQQAHHQAPHQQTQHQPQQHELAQHETDQNKTAQHGVLPADPTSGQQAEPQHGELSEALPPAPPPVAPPPPATTSAAPLAQDALLPPDHATASAGSTSTAPASTGPTSPVSTSTAPASAPADQQAAQAQAQLHDLTAAAPAQHTAGPGPTPSTAGSAPPHPARSDPAPAQPALPPEHPHEPGNALPSEHGAGGGGAPAGSADERNRSTWMTEHTTTWQHGDRSGVLGR